MRIHKLIIIFSSVWVKRGWFMNSANKLGRLSGYFAFIQTKIISLNRIFFWKDSTNFRPWKMTLKLRILRSLTRLFIILVSLTRSLFSEKMLISKRCISDLMPSLIKKYWTDSNLKPLLRSHSLWLQKLTDEANEAAGVVLHTRYQSGWLIRPNFVWFI